MAEHAIATFHAREMNHTEKKYAQYLEERRMVGEIRWWDFECWKFRLADNTWYLPDFVVVDNELHIEAHEVKAQWSTGRPGWTDDARVKIKIAAEQHPIRFLAATLTKDGWQFEEFLKDREDPPPLPLFVRLVEVEDRLHATKFDTEADAKRAMELLRFACGVARNAT